MTRNPNFWPDHSGARAQKAKGEATAFRLWQAATAMDWRCSVSEAARVAGLNRSTAISAARRKGWMGRFKADEFVAPVSGGLPLSVCEMIGETL